MNNLTHASFRRKNKAFSEFNFHCLKLTTEVSLTHNMKLRHNYIIATTIPVWRDVSTLLFLQKHNLIDMTRLAFFYNFLLPTQCWLPPHFFFPLLTNCCYYESKLSWSLEADDFNIEKHELSTTYLSSDAWNDIPTFFNKAGNNENAI